MASDKKDPLNFNQYLLSMILQVPYFSKAPDKVSHQRLVMKLERFGIHGNFLS